MNGIRPTTTPTLNINTDVDLSAYEVELTLACRGSKIIHDATRLTIEATPAGSQITDTLTAQETLSFPAGAQVKVQIRAKNGETVMASNIGVLSVDEILNDAVM